MDGDTDSPTVQREFEKIIRQHSQTLLDQQASANLGAIQHIGKLYTSDRRKTPAAAAVRAQAATSGRQRELTVQDMEADPPPGVVPTISHHISLVNGGGAAKKGGPTAPGATVANGVRPSFRNMLDEADDAVDSYM